MKGKLLFIIVLVTLNAFSLYSQQKDTWFAFWNEDTTLIGFKNRQGEIKIEPKFFGFTTARKLDHIMAGMEEQGGSFVSYYLTKSGRKVGVDSLLIIDNSTDCESEGFIRFRDPITHQLGQFDRNGNIAVPSIYNDLSSVMNGLIIALRGAEREVLHPEDPYFFWKGGEWLIIDTTNTVLVEQFTDQRSLNLYSLRIDSVKKEDPIRLSYQGTSGLWYSFIDYQLEFMHWLKSHLLNDFRKDQLLRSSHDTITYWDDENGWLNREKTELIDRNFDLIKDHLIAVNDTTTNFQLFNEAINPYIFEDAEWEQYFNNCGEALKFKYPMLNIVIDRKHGVDLVQDHFEFLRMPQGYRLVGLTIRGESLK